MKITIISHYGVKNNITANHVPRIGERVDMFYNPAPTVTDVINFPSDDTKGEMGIPHDTDVLVFVK